MLKSIWILCAMMCVYIKRPQKSPILLHKWTLKWMKVQKHETLIAISEAISTSNRKIFGIYTSLLVNSPLAYKKCKNRKWFLQAYFPLCIIHNILAFSHILICTWSCIKEFLILFRIYRERKIRRIEFWEFFNFFF